MAFLMDLLLVIILHCDKQLIFIDLFDINLFLSIQILSAAPTIDLPTVMGINALIRE